MQSKLPISEVQRLGFVACLQGLKPESTPVDPDKGPLRPNCHTNADPRIGTTAMLKPRFTQIFHKWK
jgi:hypothetical protein